MCTYVSTCTKQLYSSTLLCKSYCKKSINTIMLQKTGFGFPVFIHNYYTHMCVCVCVCVCISISQCYLFKLLHEYFLCVTLFRKTQSGICLYCSNHLLTIVVWYSGKQNTIKSLITALVITIKQFVINKIVSYNKSNKNCSHAIKCQLI